MIEDKINKYLGEASVYGLDPEDDAAIGMLFKDAEDEMKQILSSNGRGDPLGQALILAADVFDSIEQEKLADTMRRIANKWGR